MNNSFKKYDIKINKCKRKQSTCSEQLERHN